MSYSVWPHRLQPTRLPSPWDSLGKNTGVGCHFLLQCMRVKSKSEFAQSCLTLSNPMDCNLPGSFIHGIFQARVLEWGAITFSRGYLQNTSMLEWYLETCYPSLSEEEEDSQKQALRRRGGKNTEQLYKKYLHDPDNHNKVFTHLEPDILECKVKWALGSITMNKTSEGDGIPVELFQILKDDAVKVLHSICQQIWKTQQWP